MSSADAIAVSRREFSGAALLVALAAVLAAVVVAYWQTFASLVSLWRQSDTFAHCFLILPISLYLIWRRRDALERAPTHVSWLGVAAIAVLAVGWFVASSANVQVGQQLAVVLMLPAAVLALVGGDATRLIAFPLAFLLFAVPFGEVLIPALMDITATFTVAALRVTGIPVLREGLYFSIPSGDFEVAKACSGIRYLAACLTLGTLYSYLNFRSWRKRAVFIAISAVAPVIANGLRAYMIVMIAHLSELKYAVGVDHLIYGWLFFGGLIALLFWGGSFFRDAGENERRADAPVGAPQRDGTLSLAVPAAVAVACVVLGPYLFYGRDAGAADAAWAMGMPVLRERWRGPITTADAWRLEGGGAARSFHGSYASGATDVAVDVLAYGRQAPGAEMVGAMNTMIDERRWQVLETGLAADVGGLTPRELLIRDDNGGRRVVWYWYEVDGSRTAADWRAKALEAWNQLVHGSSASALVVVSARASDDSDAREALADFVRAARSAIEDCLKSRAESCSEGS
jgi:exosortase A